MAWTHIPHACPLPGDWQPGDPLYTKGVDVHVRRPLMSFHVLTDAGEQWDFRHASGQAHDPIEPVPYGWLGLDPARVLAAA